MTRLAAAANVIQKERASVRIHLDASGNYEAVKNIFAAANEQGCPISGK